MFGGVEQQADDGARQLPAAHTARQGQRRLVGRAQLRQRTLDRAVHRRDEAGRARVYASVRIITIFAVGFSLALLVLNRAYLVAYDDLLGQAVLGLVGGLYATAYRWITRASHADRPGRFLSTDGHVGSG